MGDDWNKGYFSAGPQRSYEAQQAQHYRREQEQARADEQRRADERRRGEELIQAERARAAEFHRTMESAPAWNRTPSRRARFVSAAAPTKSSPWFWYAAAVVGGWWISATLIALALEKMSVSQALATKIGVWALPALVASALVAGICWFCWALLKATWEGYLAHRRVIHIVAVFALLLASVQLGLVRLIELSGFSTVGIGMKVFAANVAASALATWLVMRKAPRFFK